MSFDPYKPPSTEPNGSQTSSVRRPTIGTLAAALIGVSVGIEVVELVAWLTSMEIEWIATSLRRASSFARVAGVVVFLVWIHRIVKNVHRFGVQGVENSPGRAVGLWFVPILNLVHGYKVVAEAWRASDPEDAGDDSHRWVSRRADNVILHWWLAFIASRIVIAVARADARPALVIASIASEVVAAVLMTVVVRRLDARQDSYARRLVERREEMAARG